LLNQRVASKPRHGKKKKFDKVIRVYAMTANFKGAHDAAGGTTKTDLKKKMQLGVLFRNAPDIFYHYTTGVIRNVADPDTLMCPLEIDKKLDSDKSAMGKLYRRMHFLAIDTEDISDELRIAAETDDHIIITDLQNEKFNPPNVKGIQSNYEFTATSTSLEMRGFSCACDNCWKNRMSTDNDPNIVCTCNEFRGEKFILSTEFKN
jgi:hypothetical protein